MSVCVKACDCLWHDFFVASIVNHQESIPPLYFPPNKRKRKGKGKGNFCISSPKQMLHFFTDWKAKAMPGDLHVTSWVRMGSSISPGSVTPLNFYLYSVGTRYLIYLHLYIYQKKKKFISLYISFKPKKLKMIEKSDLKIW